MNAIESRHAVKTIHLWRWVARVWSIASVLFVAAFAVSSAGDGALPNVTEWVALGFFPIGVVAGLALAWRWEGTGGAIAVLSLVAFYLWMGIPGGRLPHGPYFMLVAAPGFLFLASWLLERPQVGKDMGETNTVRVSSRSCGRFRMGAADR